MGQINSRTGASASIGLRLLTLRCSGVQHPLLSPQTEQLTCDEYQTPYREPDPIVDYPYATLVGSSF